MLLYFLRLDVWSLFPRDRSNSQLVSILIFNILLCGIVFSKGAFGAVIHIKFSTNDDHWNGTQKFCLKKECIYTASQILQNIDETVNPCDNFYNFACGNFIKSRRIPYYQHFESYAHSMNREIINRMKKLLEKDDDEFWNPIDISDAKRAYRLCMNTDEIKQNGLKRLMKVLNSLGGLPLLIGNHWKEEKFNFIEIVHKLRAIGYPYNYLLLVNTSPNTTVYALSIRRPKINDINFQNVYEEREQYMKDVFSVLKLNGTLISKDIKDMLDFEYKLLGVNIKPNVTVAPAKSFFLTYKSIFPLEGYIKNLLPEHKIISHANVISLDKNFFDYFVNLMIDTPKRVQANYLLWRVIESSIKKLFVTEFDAVSYDGLIKRAPRLERCIAIMQHTFPTLQLAYLKTYFYEKQRTSAKEYINNLKDALIHRFKNNIWMDEISKGVIIDKLEHTNIFVGYSEKDLYSKINDMKMKKLEESLETGIHQEFCLQAYKNEADKHLGKWGRKVHKSNWPIEVTKINAIYSYLTNSAYIPAGILGGNVFNENRPSYMNYGSLGFIVSHELSHVFDLQGNRHDKYGARNEEWSGETKRRYYDRINCVFRQYYNYTYRNMSLSARKTINEGITDISGFKTAYAAYVNSNKKDDPKPLLPGLNYNDKQLFWISATQFFCTKVTDRHILNSIQSDIHDLPEIRILKSFALLDEFSKDFNCPLGSKMNPKDKCSLW